MDRTDELNQKVIERRRKPYIRPEIEIVQLLPKQTVLSFPCHTSSKAGPVEPCVAYGGGCHDNN